MKPAVITDDRGEVRPRWRPPGLEEAHRSPGPVGAALRRCARRGLMFGVLIVIRSTALALVAAWRPQKRARIGPGARGEDPAMKVELRATDSVKPYKKGHRAPLPGQEMAPRGSPASLPYGAPMPLGALPCKSTHVCAHGPTTMWLP